VKGCLLIVDDEEHIRDMLSRHFRFLEYDVITAGNGAEALARLGESKVDVVISDIVMPEVDGVELLRALRSQYPMIHAVMITGYVTLENALACMRLGADTCIFKPLEDLKELEDAVDSAVDRLKCWHKKLLELKGMKGKGGGNAR